MKIILEVEEIKTALLLVGDSLLPDCPHELATLPDTVRRALAHYIMQRLGLTDTSVEIDLTNADDDYLDELMTAAIDGMFSVLESAELSWWLSEVDFTPSGALIITLE